jgi:hypothetical protein
MCLSTVFEKPNKTIKNGFKVFIYENNKICGLYWSYYKLNRIKRIASKLYCDKNIKTQTCGIPVEPYPQGKWIAAIQHERLFSEDLKPYNSGFHFFEAVEDADSFIRHYYKAIQAYKKHYDFYSLIEDHPLEIFAIESKQIIASGIENDSKCHVAKQIKIGEEIKWETELT